MISIKLFNKQEKQELLKKLKEQFGINELPFNLVRWGKERIIILPNEITEKIINLIGETAIIENLGLYFAKEETDGIRLSIEGTHLLKNQIKKRVVEIDEKQAEQWMLGQELNISTKERGFHVIKYKDDFLGTGKSSTGRITNFVPKNRRLKSKEI